MIHDSDTRPQGRVSFLILVADAFFFGQSTLTLVNSLHVVNIKCGGCEKNITSNLERVGLSNISIDIPNQTISFDGDTGTARTILSKIGYPEAGTKEAESILKKAHSYISCAVGKTM